VQIINATTLPIGQILGSSVALVLYVTFLHDTFFKGCMHDKYTPAKG